MTRPGATVLLCCGFALGACGGGGGDPSSDAGPAAALPAPPPEDPVEFVALVEAEAWATSDPDLPVVYGRLPAHRLHNEAIEARFYRLDAPASAAELVAASGIHDRDCTEYPSFPDEPWTIFTHLPTASMRPVNAGQVLTLTTSEGSATELVRHGTDGDADAPVDLPYTSRTVTPRVIQPEEIVLHRAELNVPGAEFPPLEPIRLPVRYADLSSQLLDREGNCMDCVGDRVASARSYYSFYSPMLGEHHGDSQKVVAFQSRYLAFREGEAGITEPNSAVCRGDDLQPLLFDEAEAAKAPGTFAGYWMGHVGTTTERRGDVLVLTSYVANRGPFPDPRRYNQVRD